MTTPLSADYPKPIDWPRFEQISCALFSAIYERQFQRWGRGGQRQDGVDVFMVEASGKTIALQCKGRRSRPGRKLKAGDIDNAVKEIETFPLPIDEFFILTTSDDDVAMHNKAAAISIIRAAQGKCRVSVWGWETICSHIGEHESIQRAYFGHWFSRLSFKQWISRAITMSLITVIGYAGTVEFLDWRKQQTERNEASIGELQQFVKLTDDLKSAYSKCDDVLVDNLFTYSANLRISCTEPVATRLDKINKQIEKVSAALDADSWSEINDLSKLMFEDYRQSLIAVDLTNMFEEEVIKGMKEFCLKPAFRSPSDSRREAAHRAGLIAIKQQLHFYFVLRDFILPGLQSMKARAMVHARLLEGTPLPADLVNQANALPRILQDRQNYKYLEPQNPFTISAIKSESSRDITSSTSSLIDNVEQARWVEVYSLAPLKIFYGRPNEVETLIHCGVFRPEARSLTHKL